MRGLDLAGHKAIVALVLQYNVGCVIRANGEQLRQKGLKQPSFYSCKLTAIEGLTPLIIHFFLSIPSDKADKDDPVFTRLPHLV